MTEAISDGPRVVSAGNGAEWWVEGWRIFSRNAWMWIGIMFVYLLLSGGMQAIPFVGHLGQWLLTPVFMGGIMIGCKSVERDGTLRLAHLFEGFQGAHFVPLMIIGAVNIGLVLAAAAIIAAGGLGLAHLVALGQASDPATALADLLDSMTTGAGLLALFGSLVIVAVFAMLNWFAPAVVALDGSSAVRGMKLSFLACLRNWLPFLVYGAIGIVILLGFGVAMVLLAVAIGASAFMSGSTAVGVGAAIGVILLIVGVVFVAMLVVGPIMFASVYAGYKDTLEPADPAFANEAYR